jgi:hypothetical protein
MLSKNTTAETVNECIHVAVSIVWRRASALCPIDCRTTPFRLTHLCCPLTCRWNRRWLSRQWNLAPLILYYITFVPGLWDYKPARVGFPFRTFETFHRFSRNLLRTLSLRTPNTPHPTISFLQSVKENEVKYLIIFPKEIDWEDDQKVDGWSVCRC